MYCVTSYRSGPFNLEQHAKDSFLDRSPPLWAMGMAHTLQNIAHKVGSYKNKNIYMADTNMRNSNFIGPN